MNTAVYIHAARDVRIGEIVPPKETEGRALVEIASVGICGSDLHYYKDGGIGAATIKAPFVPGHEFSAYLKADIESRALRRGQLVAIDPALPCMQCQWCAKGYENLCPNVEFIGAPPFNGALTQTLSVPTRSIVALPDEINADQAAMLEPLGVCIHALDLAKPRLLESAAVLGCGPIGLGVLQLLKLSPVGELYAVDPLAHRTAVAELTGVRASGQSISTILDHTDGLGCDLVIEATNSPNGFADAIAACKIGGRIILVGIPDGDDYATIKASDARRKGLTILFSRRMGDVYPRAITLVKNASVDVDRLVSHRFALAETADAFAMQADEQDGLIKSLIYPQE